MVSTRSADTISYNQSGRLQMAS